MYHIYGREGCKYCKLAVELLSDEGFPFDYHDIEADAEAKQKLIDMGAKSVPQVFYRHIDGQEEHVGGYNELYADLKT